MPETETEGQGMWADDEDRARRGREAYEQEQLSRYAQRRGEGSDLVEYWVFFEGDHPRTRETTLGLIRMFTGLGLEPTGFLKADVFIALYDRVVALEQEIRSSRLGL